MQKLFPTRFIHGDADQKSTPQIDPDLGGTRPNVRLKGICRKTFEKHHISSNFSAQIHN